jgi:hypothetical protein
VVSGLSFVLLLRLRDRVPSNYLASGFCLIYLAIGNSVYFFGRSHEFAIIVLSAVLLLLLFLLLDLVGLTLANRSGKPASQFIYRNLATILSLAFIASITICYGDSIIHKAAIQARNAGKGQLIYPSEVPKENVLNVIAEVKSVTGDNPKVYFACDNDFLLDYYGGYNPVGYYNPVYSWVSKREFNKFLQGLVDEGYYLVVDNVFAQEVLSSINISNYRSLRLLRCMVVWK